MSYHAPRVIVCRTAATLCLGTGLCFAGPAYADTQLNETRKLTASDGVASDFFGVSVAVSGNTAIVGAWGDDDLGTSAGSAYLFNVTTGSQVAKLHGLDTAAGDAFGNAVAISGGIGIIGASQDDDAGTSSGSAYLFDVSTGNQLFKLTALDAAVGDQFGRSVAISGGVAIVGAFTDDDAGTSSGSAYLFDVTTGNQIAKLTASDAARGDFFGSTVAISGDTAIVGAGQNSEAGGSSGAAYLFDVTTGNQIAKLTALDAAPGDQFGGSVAISGNIAIIGAEFDGDSGNDSGSAYLFDVNTGNQLFKLTASDGAAGDRFGTAVAISGNIAIVGAMLDDHSVFDAGSAYLFDVTTGNQIAKLTASDATLLDKFGSFVAISGGNAIVGAFQNDEMGLDSGAAYLFTIPEPASAAALAPAVLALMAGRRIR
jgi:WD40 repeat protein